MEPTRQSAKRRIFDLLRSGQELTRQDIAAKLSLSMPTTLQNVTELSQAGILEECGAVSSSGGRKARKVRLCRQSGLALGIDVGLRRVDFVLSDLLGAAQCTGGVRLAFRDRPEWYGQLQEAALHFCAEHRADPGQILGAGVSFPGIIDAQANEIVRSHILDLAHVSLDRFRKSLPFPAVFANDANSACFAERSAARSTFVHLSLNESVGGAILVDGRLWLGDTFQAGELGHMTLVPGGRRCYCGKQGCADAYLSPQALERDGWDSYLEHLAILLSSLRMLLNMDIVVGGQVGAQIEPHLDDLCARTARYDRFARDIDYVFPCVQREHACAVGAAKLALEAFGSRVLHTSEEESW